MESDTATTRKVVLLGDIAVGKTSIIQRFCYGNSVHEQHQPTVGAIEHTKTFTLNQSNKQLTLKIWDVSGQEKFKQLTSMYFRDADGIILVYDITNPDSFSSMKEWAKEVEGKAPDNIVLTIVGNKCDR